MTVPDDLTFVCLIRVDPRKFPRGTTLRSLPEDLSSAVSALVQSACVGEKYYLVRDYATVSSAVNTLAEPFDEVARSAESTDNVLPLFGGRHDTLLN